MPGGQAPRQAGKQSAPRPTRIPAAQRGTAQQRNIAQRGTAPRSAAQRSAAHQGVVVWDGGEEVVRHVCVGDAVVEVGQDAIVAVHLGAQKNFLLSNLSKSVQ